MLEDDPLRFKVVRTDSHGEVIARAINLLVGFLRRGDVLTVTRIDRLARMPLVAPAAQEIGAVSDEGHMRRNDFQRSVLRLRISAAAVGELLVSKALLRKQ